MLRQDCSREGLLMLMLTLGLMLGETLGLEASMGMASLRTMDIFLLLLGRPVVSGLDSDCEVEEHSWNVPE